MHGGDMLPLSLYLVFIIDIILYLVFTVDIIIFIMMNDNDDDDGDDDDDGPLHTVRWRYANAVMLPSLQLNFSHFKTKNISG